MGRTTPKLLMEVTRVCDVHMEYLSPAQFSDAEKMLKSGCLWLSWYYTSEKKRGAPKLFILSMGFHQEPLLRLSIPIRQRELGGHTEGKMGRWE